MPKYKFIYETPQGETKARGVVANNEDEAYDKFYDLKLGVVRDVKQQ